MSELVTLRHPTLPAEQVIQVDRRRIGARLAAGWVEVPTESPDAEPDPKQPDAEPEKPKRRSRQTSEDND